jgi:hypothetical protein
MDSQHPFKVGDRVTRKIGKSDGGTVLDFWRSEGRYSALHKKVVGKGVKARVKWDNNYTSKISVENLKKC